MRIYLLTKIFVLSFALILTTGGLYSGYGQDVNIPVNEQVESDSSGTAERGAPTPMPKILNQAGSDTDILFNKSMMPVSPSSITTTVNGFSNEFTPSNWIFDADGGDGAADTGSAPNSIILSSSDNQSGAANNTTYCITIPGSNAGILSFNWDYESYDQDGPQYDPFGYAINSVTTQLSNDFGAEIQSGSESFSLNPGDQFCFVASSSDQLLGRAVTVLSSFSFEPTTENSFTTSGTWTAPNGVTEIIVEVWGAGGGGAATSGGNDGKGGGGGGAYAQQTIPVIPGTTYNFTVGNGGTPGANGGDTFFNDGSLVFAAGGASGNDTNGGAGGSAAASTGSLVLSGGSGGAGQTGGGPPVDRTGGGGGGSAFTNNDGSPGADGQRNDPGTGGNGTGIGGNGGQGGGNGQPGQIPGGGGGGGGRGGNSNSGADGQIIISYELPPAPDPDQTTITADPAAIVADGVSTTLVTVQGIDPDGNTLTLGGATVTLSATDGTLSSVTDNGDGTYTAMLTSSTDPGITTVSGTVNGDPVTDTAEVEFTPDDGTIYYSRQSGEFDNSDNWSFTGHDGNAAGFIPGSNDIIFIGGNAGADHTITLVDNFTINDPGVLTVRDTGGGAGNLATGQFSLSGSGQFILEDGATLQIGSPDGITLSDASGNIQTATRSFSENANYIYNGTGLQVTGSALPVNLNDLTIDNPGNVEADQSYRVNGTLFLTSGAFVISDGLSLIANSKNVNSGELIYRLEIYGQPGYRMLSSPVGTDFNNFLSGILTQGYTGASLTGDLQPNVLWYEESFEGTDNQRWRAPGNSSDPVVTGRGYFAFMFGDIPEDSRYNDPLPYQLEVNGLENEGGLGEIDMNVTYTAEADTGWNMVGNPYGAAIDWDHPSWTKTNIDQTIYVWDPNTNQYLTWNGSTGDITDGIIAPFQGFWIKANDENPELILSEDAKTFGGSYAGKETAPQEVPLISINAQHSRRYQSTAHFTFSESGSYTLDREDAYKLLPPPGISDYLEVYSLTNGGERLAINNIPRQFGAPITIPFSINAFKDGFPITEEIKLNIVNFEHIPESWELELVNEQTGQRFDLRQEQSITVPMDHLASQSNAKAHKTDFEVVTKDENSHNQFKLIIRPGLDAEGLPDSFELKQNYPNPFNPSTTFRFDLPIESDVKIEIYDMLGRRVANLVDGTLPAGSHERIWDASRFSSGVYISRMITNNGVFVKKLTLIK